MNGNAGLFSSILTSTIWLQDHPTRIVWITLLCLKDSTGYVSASIPGLAGLANVTLAEAEAALDKFKSPDPYSRTKDFEGRRIEEVDGGWRILNHDKYKMLISKDSRREYHKNYKRKMRQNVDKCGQVLTNVDKNQETEPPSPLVPAPPSSPLSPSTPISPTSPPPLNPPVPTPRYSPKKSGENPSEPISEPQKPAAGGGTQGDRAKPDMQHKSEDAPLLSGICFGSDSVAQSGSTQRTGGKRPLKPKSELQLRIEKLFRRKTTTPLTVSEERAWLANAAAINAASEEDLKLLEEFYGAPQSETYTRREFATLLNNWNGEIDKAKSWKQNKQTYGKTHRTNRNTGTYNENLDPSIEAHWDSMVVRPKGG